MNNYRTSFLGSIPSAVKNILIINLIVFLAQNIIRNVDVAGLLGMYYFQSAQFRLFQMITYMFVHANTGHIFFNMFAVYMFGSLLERVWGAKKFLFFYFFTGIGAGIAQQLVWYLANVPNGITIGASGAVFGILLAFAWLFPNEKLYIMFIPIPVKAKWVVIGYSLMELFLGVASFSGDNVAHFAHLGGLVFGVILMLYWKSKNKLYN